MELRNELVKLTSENHRMNQHNLKLKNALHGTVDSLGVSEELEGPDRKRIKTIESNVRYLVEVVQDLSEWHRMPVRPRAPEPALYENTDNEPFPPNPYDIENNNNNNNNDDGDPVMPPESPTMATLDSLNLDATGSNLLAPDEPIEEGVVNVIGAPTTGWIPGPDESQPQDPVLDELIETLIPPPGSY
jgi:hypothetical protein